MNENETSFCAQDLREIRFAKASSQNDFGKLLNDAVEDSYICLGHFDVIKVAKLRPANDETIFDIINNACHNNCESTDIGGRLDDKNSNYEYPLYVINDDFSEKINNFWEEKLAYFAVSRVHCSEVNETPQKDVLKMVKQLEKEYPCTSSDKNVGEVTLKIKNQLVHCVIYNTLELGDVSVITKSSSLVSCLTFLKELLQFENVGDVYSYCGIHKDLISDRITSTQKELIQIEGSDKKETLAFADEKVPFISIRFSVRSIRYAESILEKLNLWDKVFYITGTADAILQMNDTAAEDIINVFKKLINETFEFKDGDISKNISIFEAFDDIITRIGLEFGDISKRSKKPWEIAEKNLNFSKETDDFLKEIRVHVSDKNPAWLHVLLIQYNTLKTMLRNCVMDDLSLLIWPSVSAFVQRLSCLCVDSERQDIVKSNSRFFSDIKVFLNGWSVLADDIAHLESQLTQNPELQAARYYIPSTLLSVYMAFLDKFNQALKGINSDNEYVEYVPLISHDIGNRISTICILDPSNYSKKYSGKCPLLVSLPVSMMYRPFETIVSLCHEISHYSGEESRLRERRLQGIVNSSAGLLSIAWKLDGRVYPLKVETTEVIENVSQKMMKLYEDVVPASYDKLYISTIQKILPPILSEIVINTEWQMRFFYANIKGAEDAKVFMQYASNYVPKRQYDILNKLHSRLQNLLLLYRECYADLVAVISLQLTKEEYFYGMFYREFEMVHSGIERKEDDQLKLQLLQLRCALVLSTFPENYFTQSRSGVALDGHSLDRYKDWNKTVECFINSFSTKKEIYYSNSESSKKILVYPCEYLHLKDYLQECRNVIEKNEQNREENGNIKKELREILNLVSNKNTSMEALSEINNKYRKTKETEKVDRNA